DGRDELGEPAPGTHVLLRIESRNPASLSPTADTASAPGFPGRGRGKPQALPQPRSSVAAANGAKKRRNPRGPAVPQFAHERYSRRRGRARASSNETPGTTWPL